MTLLFKSNKCINNSNYNKKTLSINNNITKDYTTCLLSIVGSNFSCKSSKVINNKTLNLSNLDYLINSYKHSSKDKDNYYNNKSTLDLNLSNNITINHLNYIKNLNDYNNKHYYNQSEMDIPTLFILDNFNLSGTPSLNIKDFLCRLLKYGEFSNTCIIYSTLLINKLIRRLNIKLTKENIYLFFLISLIISVKITDDYILDNLKYSNIGGISLELINELELQFIKLIDHNLYISFEEIDKEYCKNYKYYKCKLL